MSDHDASATRCEGLTPRQRWFVLWWFTEGEERTLRDMAEELGVTPSAVQHVGWAACAKLRWYGHDAGLASVRENVRPRPPDVFWRRDVEQTAALIGLGNRYAGFSSEAS